MVKVPNICHTSPRHSYKPWSSPPPHPPLLRPTLTTGTQAGNWQWWEDLKDSCSSGPLSCQETTPLPGTCELGVAHAGGFKGFSHLSRYPNTQFKKQPEGKDISPFPNSAVLRKPPRKLPEILEPVAFCNRRHSPEPNFSTCRGRTRISGAGSARKPQQAPTCSELTGAQGSRSRGPSPGRHLPSKLRDPARGPGAGIQPDRCVLGTTAARPPAPSSGPPRPRWSRGQETVPREGAEKGGNKHKNTRRGRGRPEGAAGVTMGDPPARFSGPVPAPHSPHCPPRPPLA